MLTKQFLVILSLLILMFSGAVLIENCSPKQQKTAIAADSTAYVGSATCKTCHAKEYADWQLSDHQKAMSLPTDSVVLGNFNNSSFTADGVTSHFFKKDGKFFINTQGPDGLSHDYQVKYTFGYFPLQQYLVDFPGGRMQATRLSWDSRLHKWFNQYAGQVIQPNDWLHWTGNGQNWNTMCASCHSTNLQKNYNPETDTYHTTFNEINVSCESCHGAGKSHIDYINTDYKSGNKIAGSLIKIASGTEQIAQINNCAPCHVRAASVSANAFNPSVHSGELMEDMIPEIPSIDHYYADGQANDEDYTYTSFAESKMFSRGVKCSNCHNPHSGHIVLTGNMVCLQCHAKTYDAPTHTFHRTGSTGAECKNCHMPGKVYMGNDLRYDHTFRVPRPDLSVQYSTPNACNNCHKNQTAKWAADAVVKWYGPARKYHFAEDLIPGSKTDNQAEAHLLKLLGDTAVPSIIHATAAHYLNNFSDNKSTGALLKCLQDKDAQVRYRALKSLADFPAATWLNVAGNLLTDPVKSVRIAAAELYSNLPNDQVPAAIYPAFSNAKQEMEHYLFYQADFAIGNVMIGDYYLKQKNYTGAEQYYLRALKKDAAMNYVRLNLSAAYNNMNKNKEALHILLEAQKTDPKNDRVYFNLGLLYNELNNTKEAANSFEKAMALHTANPRVYYNYGLLTEQHGDFPKAEAAFLKGLAISPEDGGLNYALALLYVQTHRKEKALQPVTILKRIGPNNPDYQQLFSMFGY